MPPGMATTPPERNTLTTTTNTQRSHHHVINGALQPGLETFTRISPATGLVVAEYARGTREDAQAAVEAARQAFDHGPWPEVSGIDRRDLLHSLADEMESHRDQFIEIEIEETGKPIRLARGDIDGAIGLTRYAAGLAVGVHGDAYTNLGPAMHGYVVREPIGVAGLIVPWNFPTLILCQKLPFALAAGCTAVVKPSEFTPGGAVLVAELAKKAGIPDGVVNVVTGFGEVGAFLAESPDVDIVSFTGSTATGRKVMTAAASNVKKVSLELGGKAANIVFGDADLEDAIDGTLFAIFFNQGECCVSGARLLIEESVADDFVSSLKREAQRLNLGDPYDEETDVGALIHSNHVEKVMSYIEAGIDEGAELIAGGKPVAGSDATCYVEPTIFDRVEPGMTIFQEEIFGPVLTVTRFSTDDEAVALANDTPYGLANAIWTKNIDRALSVAGQLRSGTVWINTNIAGSPQLPFGGYKGSGFGREMGEAGLEEFTEVKTITIGLGKRDPFFVR